MRFLTRYDGEVSWVGKCSEQDTEREEIKSCPRDIRQSQGETAVVEKKSEISLWGTSLAVIS